MMRCLSGIIASSISVTSGGGYILDSLTASSKAAYSLRKLLTAGTDEPIRIRRSSDDAEQDITFHTNDAITLDSKIENGTTSLETWIGSNDGYIDTWYDQTANGNDATEATTTKQLRIIVGGVFETSNSLPACRTVSGEKGVEKTFASALTQPYTISSVIETTSSDKTWYYGGGTSALFGHFNGKHEWYAGTDLINTGLSISLDYNVYTNIFNGSSSTAYRNGTDIYSGTVAIGSNTLPGITIGHSNLGSPNTSDISFGEVIIFDSSLSTSDRETLESDQASYYGT